MESRGLSVFIALIVVSVLFVDRSAAEGLSGYLETSYSKFHTVSTDSAGQSTNTTSDSITQRYSITLDKRLYPNLGLLAGGLFEKRDVTLESGDVDIDSTSTKMRPFVNLSLRTPLYTVEAGYNRNEDKQKSSGLLPVVTVRETWSSTLSWRPVDLPDAKLEYFRTENFDKEKKIQNAIDSRFGFTTQYRPVLPVYLRYQVSFGEREDRLSNVTVDEIAHNGKVSYSDRLWQRRISVVSDYSFVHSETKTAAEGGGEVGFPIFSFLGLSAISDVPESVALLPNTLLIDGDFTTNAGINIGRPLAGEDARQRNIGLDFATDREINTILVSVDRDVTQVADAFSWRIYTSSDNLNWVLRQTVSPATFNSFSARFEIRFSNVTTRYVKVVVAPLSPAVPFASNFPSILVTELQGEVRRPASEVTRKTSSTIHLYNLDVRTLVLEKPSLFHEFSLFLRKIDPLPSLYTISNGLSLQHQFSKVFSGRARVSREDGKELKGTRVAYLYTASLAAVPLDTLRHSLVFSGSDESAAGSTSTANSLFLYNSAKLYDGIDVNLGGGISRTEVGTGQKTDQSQVNASAYLVPHRVMTFNLTYSGTSTKTNGGEITGQRKDTTDAWEAGLSLTPVQTVYLFGSYRIENVEQGGNGERRNMRNFIANWAPFPDGTVHFNFYYNESFLSENKTRNRSIVPSLRWNVTARSYLDLSYQNVKTESMLLTTDTRVVSGTVHIGF